MADCSKNSSSKYKKDFKQWDENYERIYGKEDKLKNVYYPEDEIEYEHSNQNAD